MHDYCGEIYKNTYEAKKESIENELRAKSRTGQISLTKEKEIEAFAQKEAIKKAMLEGMRHYSNIDVATIWNTVYETHVHRKSGIRDGEIISKVISADQSWKKSSGHAFEEMVKTLASAALHKNGIQIILQRELNSLIKKRQLHNQKRDIEWLKAQIKANIFDLYAIVTSPDGENLCFGCIQSKTSIRDRVTRDREPSIHAMEKFFWSTIIVLDGDFLKLPKFVSMVNGGTLEHKENGWHGMYVFSDDYSQDRIYAIDINFKNFKEHAIKAANSWLKERQWLDINWKAS